MKSVLSLVVTIACVFALGAVSGSPPRSQYADIDLPPVATFKDYCARCHGYEGSAYGKNFANINDDSLKAITEDMMFGPAGLNPDSVSVAAMVAYNRALSRKLPFVVVLNSRSIFGNRDSVLIIEASPGAIVAGADSARNGRTLVWRMPYDRNNGNGVRITVTKNGVSSVIRFPDDLWSR